MKQVFYIAMSSNEKVTEDKINEAIRRIGKDYKVEWLTHLIKAIDPDKYMLIAERTMGAVGQESPDIGVKIVQGSQDKKKTEDMINETFRQLEIEGKTNFISICHPTEFMYIILYENKSGTYPRVAIVPNPINPISGSRKMTYILKDLEKEYEGLEPVDMFKLDKDSMMFIYSEV